MGNQIQWLKIVMQSESIQGDYKRLLCKSEGITANKTVFSGTGNLFFSGSGKIKQFYLDAQDSIVLKKTSVIVTDITTEQNPLSASYLDLVTFSGPGAVFVCGKGDFVEFYLEEGETVKARTQCIIAMDSTVKFELGSRFSELSGPGAVLLESAIPEEEESKELTFFDRL